MSFEVEIREALHLVESIELGRRDIWDTFQLIQAADPTLVYFVFTWLRSRYANDPSGDGVMGRMVKICQEHPATLRIIKKGEADALVGWFEESHQYRDFSRDAFIEIIIEKLEG
ncbi:MAG: hypothetical protein GWP91_06330 [Rhodobacterales bacterium]|nr:hypothetical protein [Rhodobacterales bacterium]